METASLLGKGVYSVPEAARIIHADARSVHRWVSGYHTHTSNRFSPRILTSESASDHGQEILTFQQLIELLFVKLFRDHSVSMPTIRAAAQRASGTFKTVYPFAFAGLRTDGRDIFHLTEEDVIRAAGDEEPITKRRIAEDLKNGQTVIVEFAEPYFQKIDYDKMEAAKYWPLGKDRSVVIDPHRACGTPIDNCTRVPTNTIYSMYRGTRRRPGERAEVISKWFEVSIESVRDAIAFEESLLRKAA